MRNYLLSDLSTLLGPENVQSRVSISLGSDLSTESESREATSIETALVQVSNIHLDRAMIFSRDQFISPRAATHTHTRSVEFFFPCDDAIL